MNSGTLQRPAAAPSRTRVVRFYGRSYGGPNGGSLPARPVGELSGVAQLGAVTSTIARLPRAPTAWTTKLSHRSTLTASAAVKRPRWSAFAVLLLPPPALTRSFTRSPGTNLAPFTVNGLSETILSAGRALAASSGLDGAAPAEPHAATRKSDVTDPATPRTRRSMTTAEKGPGLPGPFSLWSARVLPTARRRSRRRLRRIRLGRSRPSEPRRCRAARDRSRGRRSRSPSPAPSTWSRKADSRSRRSR
jgi:hypothetical protein